MRIGRTARMEMVRVAMAVMAMMLNPIGGMILIAITIMNIENKHNQPAVDTNNMTAVLDSQKQFDGCEKILYITNQTQLQECLHEGHMLT